MTSGSFRTRRIGGVWLAMGGLILAAILPVHGPTHADLSVQMQHISDGHGLWAAVHWLAALALILISGAGFIFVVETLIKSRKGSPVSAWLFLAIGSLLTVGTAVTEATAISAAANNDDLEGFVTWWSFASGLGNGFMLVAFSASAIAFANARADRPPIAVWLCWIGAFVALLSAIGWILGQHLRLPAGGPLWFVSTLLMALWLAWFGYKSSQQPSD